MQPAIEAGAPVRPVARDRRSGRPWPGARPAVTAAAWPRLLTGGAVAVGCFVAALTLCLLDTLLPLSAANDVLLWSFVVAFVAAAAIGLTAVALRSRTLGLGSARIGAWYLAWVGVAFGLLSITWRGPQPDAVAIVEIQSVVVALKLIALGLLGWTVGYAVGPPRGVVRAGKARARLFAPGPGGAFALRSPAVPWILSAIAVAARWSMVSHGRFGYLGDPSSGATSAGAWSHAGSLVGSLGNMAVIVATIDLVRRPSPSRRVTLAVLLGVEVGFGLFSGMKQGFLVAVLGPVVVFAIAGRFPWRLVAAGALLFLTVVMPYNTAYRDTVRTPSFAVAPHSAGSVAATVLRTTLLDADLRRNVTDSASHLAMRIREVSGLSVVVQMTPGTIGYQPPSQLVTGPVVGLVPRAVWPNKPLLNPGYVFNQEYWGRPDTVYSSAAITPQADLYRHGGLPMLVVGMVVLGALMRLADETLHPARDLRLAVVFVPLLVLLVKSEADVVGLIAGVPPVLLLGLVGSRFAFRATGGSGRG